MDQERPEQPTRLSRREARDGHFVLELPISKQFSPIQIDSLQEFLSLVRSYGPQGGGTRVGGRAYVKDRFFSAQRRGGTEKKRLTQAGNAIASARHWGLLDEADNLTQLGEAAAAAANDGLAAEIMVKNFLRHLGGSQSVKTIFDLIHPNDGIAPAKTILAAELHQARIYENRDGTDHSAVLGWLSQPGVDVAKRLSRSRWLLNERRFAELAGVTLEQVDAVARRDPVQLALLVELARTSSGKSDAGAMQRVLAIRRDLKIDVPGFRRKYLEPLERDGLIQLTGRGAVGATTFSITPLGRQEAVVDLISRFDIDGTLHYQQTDLLRPTREIVADLSLSKQANPNLRGIALEHFALRILSWIGLTDVRWRVRPNRAEEIDGTAHSTAPSFALWQVQAKNTAKLDADDAAKEIGLAVANGATVVMLITTGDFTRAARSVIDRAERRSALTVTCIDGGDVDMIADDPAALRELLARESSRAQQRREL